MVRNLSSVAENRGLNETRFFFVFGPNPNVTDETIDFVPTSVWNVWRILRRASAKEAAHGMDRTLWECDVSVWEKNPTAVIFFVIARHIRCPSSALPDAGFHSSHRYSKSTAPYVKPDVSDESRKRQQKISFIFRYDFPRQTATVVYF